MHELKEEEGALEKMKIWIISVRKFKKEAS